MEIEGEFLTGKYDTTNSGSGSVAVRTLTGNIRVIDFTGFEPLDCSGTEFVNFDVNVDPTNVYAANLTTTIATADAGVNTLVSFDVASGLESIKLGKVTGRLRIIGSDLVNGGNSENDYFLLKGLGSEMKGDFSIDGKGGNADVVDINNTTVTMAGAGKSFSAKADFIGLGRSGPQIGTLVCSGDITLEADGDNMITSAPLSAPLLWGTGSVYGTRPAYFSLNLLTGERGAVSVGGLISKTSGADATCTLKGKAVVIVPTNGSITSSMNKLHVVMHSDTDSTNGGAVTTGQLATINTNGGNLTIGGGSDPATGPAIGLASNGFTLSNGVLISSSSINTAGGAISIRGTGRAFAGGHGVAISGTGLTDGIIDSGAGSMTIVGTGGGSFTNASGVRITGIGNTSPPRLPPSLAASCLAPPAASASPARPRAPATTRAFL
jgi:hypothetical protein